MNGINSEERLAHVQSFHDKLTSNSLSGPEEIEAHAKLEKLAHFLADSHEELKQGLAGITEPPLSEHYVRLTNTQEQSLSLYMALNWADNPPTWFREWLEKSKLFELAFGILCIYMKKHVGKKMTEAQYQELVKYADEPGLVGSDGTLNGFETYEALDDRWMIATLNYVLNIVHPKDIHPFSPHPCPPHPVETRELSVRQNAKHSDPVLGIIGDWGTGYSYLENSPAERVAKDLMQHDIDYLIHLGDTYYAGTNESRLGPDSAHEELENMVNVWPARNYWPEKDADRNYTLNSNHEMYGAAQGYFKTALDQSGLFDAQNKLSVFALRYPPTKDNSTNKNQWLVLGLDSAYFSDDENGIKMYMEGAIGTDLLDTQINQIKTICKDHEGPVMVMTHHHPCNTVPAEGEDLVQTNILYDQVVKAIGAPPQLWYWGHVHNAIVYKEMSTGKDGDGKNISSPTKSRCCGHGAFPFGPAWGLEGNSSIDYYAHTHDDAFPDDSPRVKNGYALVQLHDDGGFTESFYEVGSPDTPVWQHKWAGSDLIE